MGMVHGPNFVTDSLEIFLDAGNVKSYPGSGTAWSDLTGNGNTGTLGGPTYNSANGGHFTFDGSNDGIELPHNSYWTKTSSDSFSICLWAYVNTNASEYSALFSHQDCNDPSIQIYVSGPTTSIYYRGHDAVNATYTANVTGAWFNVVATHNGSNQGLTLYFNGSSAATATDSGSWSISSGGSEVWLGRRKWCGSTNELNGKIASFCYYSKLLSAAEVLQNYNSHKSRFCL